MAEHILAVIQTNHATTRTGAHTEQKGFRNQWTTFCCCLLRSKGAVHRGAYGNPYCRRKNNGLEHHITEYPSWESHLNQSCLQTKLPLPHECNRCPYQSNYCMGDADWLEEPVHSGSVMESVRSSASGVEEGNGLIFSFHLSWRRRKVACAMNSSAWGQFQSEKMASKTRSSHICDGNQCGCLNCPSRCSASRTPGSWPAGAGEAAKSVRLMEPAGCST